MGQRATSDLEIRTYPFEVRKSKNGKRFEGYASVFGSWSEDLGGFREIVRQGAFAKTIQEADVRATFNHDPNYVLGRRKANTLTLEEDSTGLLIVAEPPDTQWARDLAVSMDRGDIDQMSFSFRTIKDNWYIEEGQNRRELLEVSLHNGDVAVVTYPAYEKTSVGLRSEWLRTLLRIERGLPLDEEDVRTVRTFQRYAPTEPVLEDHSEKPPEDKPDPVIHLAHMRRRLRTLELSLA